MNAVVLKERERPREDTFAPTLHESQMELQTVRTTSDRESEAHPLLTRGPPTAVFDEWPPGMFPIALRLQ